MTGDFSEGSTATGILVAISSGSYLQYLQGKSEIIVQGLSRGKYDINVFAMEEGGQTVQRAATRTRRVFVNEESKGELKPRSWTITYNMYHQINRH